MNVNENGINGSADFQNGNYNISLEVGEDASRESVNKFLGDAVEMIENARKVENKVKEVRGDAFDTISIPKQNNFPTGDGARL